MSLIATALDLATRARMGSGVLRLTKVSVLVLINRTMQLSACLTLPDQNYNIVFRVHVSHLVKTRDGPTLQVMIHYVNMFLKMTSLKVQSESFYQKGTLYYDHDIMILLSPS